MTKQPEPKGGEKIIVHVDPDLEDLLPGFFDHRRQDLQALTEALERGDFEAIRKQAHTLKGVGGGYGFEEITRLARQIQEAAEQHNDEEVGRKLAALGDYLERVEVVFD